MLREKVDTFRAPNKERTGNDKTTRSEREEPQLVRKRRRREKKVWPKGKGKDVRSKRPGGGDSTTFEKGELDPLKEKKKHMLGKGGDPTRGLPTRDFTFSDDRHLTKGGGRGS